MRPDPAPRQLPGQRLAAHYVRRTRACHQGAHARIRCALAPFALLTTDDYTLLLAVTAAIATGPPGWTAFGTLIALTCTIQHRLVRDRLPHPPLSVVPVTVSEH
ncbi:hypothetical protein ABT404_43395 [Streptomyces hyaluromycini]|uniref:Uncharacterized protein n=1 Tax=Streptomyces hyaluromycini TaxID=1377993 RepID=A0ABV1XB26_9ACTN